MDWLLALLSACIGALAVLLSPFDASSWRLVASRSGSGSRSEWNVRDHFGGISPWKAKTAGIVTDIDDMHPGCVIDQVHMMSRHAERCRYFMNRDDEKLIKESDPTMLPGVRMLELYHRLQNTNETLPEAIAVASRANFYAPFPNEQFEQLTSTGPFAGTLQAFNAGTRFRTRYEGLLERALEQRQTSFWTSNSPRCIDSARYFATGFFGLDWNDTASLHIIPESVDQGGSTLTPGRACPNYIKNRNERGHEFGNRQLKAFRSSYLPKIRDRFAEESPGFLFDESEIYSMQEYCAFETLVKGDSKWCDVFTHDEWENFEYARDLLHYYRAGPGNPFAAPGGMLWLQATAELMLQGSEVGNLFFSFNHDGDIFNLLSALQLFQEPEDLPIDRVKHDRTWRLSDVTPMGARIVLERYVCPSSPPQCWVNELYPNHEHCEEQMYEPYVRLNINDGVVPIPRCQDDSPGGGCLLSNFLALVNVRDQETPDWASLCDVDEELPKRVEFLHQNQRK